MPSAAAGAGELAKALDGSLSGSGRLVLFLVGCFKEFRNAAEFTFNCLML